MVNVSSGREQSEDTLVNRARAGDASAFEALFDAYLSPITNYLYRLTGSRDAADDLAQETFLKDWRALRRVEADAPLAFRPWLYRIATNAARSWQRRQKLRSWRPFRPDRNDEPSHDPAFADRVGESEAVGDALRQVGADARVILLLRHHQQLSVEEIAETLGISANTAKVRLYRARRAFAEAYTGGSVSTHENITIPSGEVGR